VNDPKQNPNSRLQAYKAFSLMTVLSGMGGLATLFTPWRPRPFVGAKARTYRDRSSAVPRRSHEALEPKHLVAVAAMREARRAKRIIRAENLLEEKRLRQGRQLARHIHRMDRRIRANRALCSPIPNL